MDFKAFFIVAVVFLCLQLNCVYLKLKKIETPSSSVVVYTGGNGESFHDAVTINGVKNKGELISAEYDFISKKYGTRGKGWLLVEHTLIQGENRVFDVIKILVDGINVEKILYFDVTEIMFPKKK